MWNPPPRVRDGGTQTSSSSKGDGHLVERVLPAARLPRTERALNGQGTGLPAASS